MAAEALKATRRTAKGNLTREITHLNRFIAEEKKDLVVERLDKIQEKFADFQTCHDEYHATLKEEDIEDIEESDSYFFQVQLGYIEALKASKGWLRSISEVKAEPEEEAKAAPSAASDAKEFMSMINLPKVELEPFDGDPLQYHTFFAVFKESVDDVLPDGRTKLNRLLQYTCGAAKTAIRSCSLLGGDEGYEQARDILKRRFGNPHVIAEKIISGLKHGKPIKSPSDLQSLSDELTSSQATLASMDKLAEIDTQSSITEIVNRLQPYIRNRWKRHALEFKRDKDVYPSFKNLVNFVNRESEEASDPVYGSTSNVRGAQDTRPPSDVRPRTTTSFSSSVRTNGRSRYLPDCVLCGEKHKLLYCDSFKKLQPVQRLKVVKDHHLCENCLLSNHVTADCRSPYVCTVPGCGRKHSKFIHGDIVPESGVFDSQSSNSGVRVVSNVANVDTDVFVPVVSVKVNNKCSKLAILDTGSTSTFCTRRLVNELNIKGSTVDYALSTLNGSEVNKTTQIVNLCIMSQDEKDCLTLSNVYIVEDIPTRYGAIDVSGYDHLSNLPIVKCMSRVDILIGQDHAEALVPLEVSKGKSGEPFGVRTMFGWSVNGPAIMNETPSRKVINHFVSTSILEHKLDRLWEIENEGLPGHDVSMSKEDQRVIALWDEKISRSNDGHYILPIPWKSDAQLPSNIKVAQSRLYSLRRSLAKRNIMERYDVEIKKMMDKGYAEEVSEKDVSENAKIWYLPHQAVITDKKPDKLRVVYDCASKYEGESLNDKCLRGPDLNNRLLYILLRFRQHQYAIMADVEAMYYQVRVPEYDRDALRFLWYGEDGEIKYYRMTSHVFGGVWCACAATYALRCTIRDNPGCEEIVIDTVNRSFYVDDCLKSVTSKSEAKQVIDGTKLLLSKGGFKLTKFVVNDEDLMSEIPIDDRAKEVKDLQLESDSKALGVKWNVMTDEFYFAVDVTCHDVINRRIMLSTVSSTFDPLGLVSPVVIVGKILFQDATRLKLGWDDQVPPDVECGWRTWLSSVTDLQKLKIPRCIKASSFDDGHIELHSFSDASERAYGCCSYLRCINQKGEISVVLVLSKGKVTPIKTVSIPRLELQAAVLSAQVSAMLVKELDITISECYFWVDSTIVLQYIRNETRRFQVFVGNRISMIHQLSHPSQWNHVPGKENPADLITRGRTPQQLQEEVAWFHGPEFLHSYKSEWKTKECQEELSADDPEVRVDRAVVYAHVVNAGDVKPDHPLDQMLDHYSDWYRLKRAVAWLIRVKDALHHKVKKIKTRLTVQEVKSAEVVLVKHVQGQFYKKEMECLKKEKPVASSSSLIDLLPILNEDGLLCVGGRLKHATVEESMKNPIILPYRSVLSKLIARWYHDVAHLGTEWTLSWVRMKFWIVKARSLIKGIKRSCVTCKKLYGRPSVQLMCDLPSERLEPNKPPFSSVGIDCFGPYYVKLGRAEIKRYGCIFTCMCTRAVHIEKLNTLETDSFLNGLRRFAARRGYPIKAFSDNGTNIVGAQAELTKAVRQLDQDRIQKFSVEHDIQWHFNPPHASHMGGVWERVIKTIKKVMTAVLKGSRLNDEVLETVLCEVEAIVNSRPLTKVSDDVSDMATLTPNHLLLLREGPRAMPGVFGQGDIYRKRWRYIQHLADQFWRRWLKEYLPNLQARSKWTEEKPNVKKGDVVLICDENTPRNVWPMGLVIEAKVGRDNLVRTVRVKTKSSELVRPVTKIVMLEVN